MARTLEAFYFIIFLILILSCSKTAQTDYSNKKASTNYENQIAFERFPTTKNNLLKKAPINFLTNPKAKRFKTSLEEIYHNSKPNFAQYYIIATLGCGTSCLVGFMIDVRNGQVFNLPIENYCVQPEAKALTHLDSLLFVSEICISSDNKTIYLAYLWHEQNKTFKKMVNQDSVLKKY